MPLNLVHDRQADLPQPPINKDSTKIDLYVPSSATICSTGGASSSDWSGSDSISAFVTVAFLSKRNFPSQPWLSRKEEPFLEVGSCGVLFITL